MYSEDILGFMKRHRISVGDIVRAEYDGIAVEGELMPKTEAGSPDTVVIKLKSGYNVGLDFSRVRLTRVAQGSPPKPFPKSSPTAGRGLPKVSLIYTGGTIGSKLDYRTGGVHMLLEPEELFYEVPELSRIADIKVSNPFSMSSEDMASLEWQAIAKEIASELNSGARGVVVTIGTDTMHYAAAALSFMLQEPNAPVVLTGAQRSSDRGASDAFVNLICSAHIAASSDISGVGICMHSSSSDDMCHFLSGVKSRKMHSSRRDAFRPINGRPIAHAWKDGRIEYIGTHRTISGKRQKVVPKTAFESRVALVKAYPGSDPGVIGFYVKKGCRGIIIEGTGLGHAPVSPSEKENSWLQHIKDAIDSGVVVGMTTQAIYGRVNANVYRNLRMLSAAGAVYCEDMLPETAYVKLGWLLGNYSAREAAGMLVKNMVGEISQRLELGDFLV